MLEPPRISRALERVLARRAAEKKARAELSRLPWRIAQWFGGAIGVAAALAGLFGVWTWVAEAPDRAEERRVNRSQLIMDAREILSVAQASNIIDGIADPSVSGAVQTLADYGQPIALAADEVYLQHLDIKCGELEIRSRVLDMFDVAFRDSSLDWEGNSASFRYAAAGGSFLSLKAPRRTSLDAPEAETVVWKAGNFLIRDSHLALADKIELTPLEGYKKLSFENVVVLQGFQWFAYPRLNDVQGALKFPLGKCGAAGADTVVKCEAVGQPVAFSPTVPVDCVPLPTNLMDRRMRESFKRLNNALEKAAPNK